MGRLLKNRRGEIMPLVIVAMIVVFTLCAILTTLAVAEKYRALSRDHINEERIILNQIGDDFVAWAQNGQGGDFEPQGEGYGGYVFDTEGINLAAGFKLTVKKEDTNAVVLTVQVGEQGVTEWKYKG